MESKEYFPASNLLDAALYYIRDALDTVMWNIHQEEYNSPFANSGNSFKCDTYEVRAYDWGWDLDLDEKSPPQPYNFKWKDLEVIWYKYLGRSTETNRLIMPDEISIMLDECYKATWALPEKDEFGE
ncbi:MAG: hypothetical protein PHX74_10720 [Candidatus Sumerlaeales bacterium]|nr:hypothetical protein [Candidatus Sumerlaeales bacterium]